MARRPGDERRRSLTPSQRRLAGWAAALALVVGIAVVVGILGGNGDGAAVVPDASGESPGPSIAEIIFGTGIDSTTGEVATTSRIARFEADDAFAYSVRSEEEQLPTVIYVEVERTAGGPTEVVQAISEGDQTLPDAAEIIAFTVPAIRLLEEFGPGTYEMRIHLDAEGEPVAEGTFELIDPAPPASRVPSASP